MRNNDRIYIPPPRAPAFAEAAISLGKRCAQALTAGLIVTAFLYWCWH